MTGGDEALTEPHGIAGHSAITANQFVRLPDGRLVRPSVVPPRGGLVLVVGELVPDPPPACRVAFVHAHSSQEALQLIVLGSVRDRLEVVVVQDDLIDMSGLGLLERIGILLPHVARVLMLEPGRLPYLPRELAQMGLDDSWPAPRDGRELVRRLLLRRAALARTRAVYEELQLCCTTLDSLERRYAGLRVTRDRLVGNVESALAARGRKREFMMRWWQGYRAWLQLRSGICPVHLQPVPLGDFFGRLLPRQELRHWHLPARLPDREVVYLDPALMQRTGLCLLRGVAELGRPNARVGWGRLRATPQRLMLELTIDPVRPEIDDVEALLEDPYERLPDASLRGLSIDLPLAQALLRIQSASLAAVMTRPQMTLQLTLWRTPPDQPPPALWCI